MLKSRFSSPFAGDGRHSGTFRLRLQPRDRRDHGGTARCCFYLHDPGGVAHIDVQIAARSHERAGTDVVFRQATAGKRHAEALARRHGCPRPPNAL